MTEVRDQKSAVRKTLPLGPLLLALSFLSAMLFALNFPAEAQQPKKIFRIGYISGSDAATDAARSEPFRQALRELGYIEGRNIAIEYRYAEGKQALFPEVAAGIVRLKVDVIVASGDTLVRAAKNETKTIPIVMMGFGADPVETGLIENLAHPGGNITGLTNVARQLTGKRLEFLKEAVPRVVRVSFLYDPARIDVSRLNELQNTARPFGMTVRSWDVRNAEGLETVFAALSKERPDGLFVSGGALMTTYRKRIVGFALTKRLPSVFTDREAVEAGGLLYYGANLADSYRRAALYVDKILKGAQPAELPVEQPTKFELMVNLKTAKQIGLTIPPSVLARADKVIR
jgi:putative tryptophan/tyrosine transport system substrate-binding protein